MKNPIEVERIVFPNGRPGLLLRVPANVDDRRIINLFNLPSPRALLILNGGTAKLDADVVTQLQPLIGALAQLVVNERIQVITGGTQAGVFELFGQALEQCGNTSAPCIGVIAGAGGSASRLEPHHSHFVIVEGAEWGEETPLMYRLAASLAKSCPSISVFAGGGRISLTEMAQNVSQDREMILLAGSEGSTDAVVEAFLGIPAADENVKQIIRDGRVTPFSIKQPVHRFIALLRNRLFVI